MTDFNPSLSEDVDVEDLAQRLPKGVRYELRDGNLFIMTPSSFWHKAMTKRLLRMLDDAEEKPGYFEERSLLLSELEAEFKP